MRILDLFCGTKSIANTAKSFGYDVFTVDNDPQHEPDLCVDVLALAPWQIDGDFDMVWASPPCTRFSVAAISHNWEQTSMGYKPRHNMAITAVRLVERTLEIIEAFQPCVWFVENPRGLLRKLPVMDNLKRYTVTYCQYGDFRMKATDIWTNSLYWKPRPMCKNGDPCHERAPRGSRTGTQGLRNAAERSRIPYELCKEVIEAAERQIKEAK